MLGNRDVPEVPRAEHLLWWDAWAVPEDHFSGGTRGLYVSVPLFAACAEHSRALAMFFHGFAALVGSGRSWQGETHHSARPLGAYVQE